MEGADATRVCAACGAAVPTRFRFCGECGNPLGSASVEESRRTVTVLFCDLVGSTALGEGRDPEVVRTIVGRYFDVVAAAVIDGGGAVEKFIGDAVMAVFGLPVIHEDDAVRAVRAALRARDAVDELNVELEAVHDVSLRVRIGIHTGEVVAGDATTSQRMVTGDAVNVAARLEQSADVHEIVIGDPTRALAGRAVETEDLGTIALRGRAEPLRVHRVIGLRDAATTASHVFVGRQEELALIDASWRTAVDRGSPTIVCVSAPPGTGKSRLVAEFSDRRRHLGTTVVALRAAVEVGPATLLRDAVVGAGAEPEDDVMRLFDDGARDSATVTTEETVWTVARHLAAAAPLLLVLEDAHWAGPPVLDLVRRLSEFDVPLLVVATIRPEGATEVRAVAEEYLSTTWIDLPGLGSDDASALASRLVTGDIDPRVIDHLVRQTEGNPLFLEQTVSFLVEEGFLLETDGTWSSTQGVAELPVAATAAAAVSARLDALDPRPRRVLELASVIGQSFTAEAVAALGRAAGVEGVESQVPQLVRRGFLVEETSPLDRPALRFWHALVQDASYRRMLKRDRARLHELYAEWLADAGPGHAAPDVLDREDGVGTHYLRAWTTWQELSAGGAEARSVGHRAVDHLLRAGHLSLQRGEIRRAAGLLEQATQPMPSDDARLPATLVDLGTALREAGEVDRALQVLSRGLDLAQERDDVSVAWRAQWALADSPRSDANPITWDSRQGVEAARGIMPALESVGDRRGLARAWRLIALSSFHLGDAETCAEASWDGARQARLASDEREYAEIVALVPWALAEGMRPLTQALAETDGILDELRHNVRSWAFAASARAFILGSLLRTEEARAQIVGVVEALDRVGVSRWRSDVDQVAAEIEIAAGDLDAGVAALRQMQGRDPGASDVSALLCHTLLDAGRTEEARAVVDVELLGDVTSAWDAGRSTARARLLARAGRGEQARDAADQALELVRSTTLGRFRAAIALETADTRRVLGDEIGARETAEAALRLFAGREDHAGAARVHRFLAAAG